ncbi:hypothetical protein [Micromonospora inyonensis]|uniref:hypothetical protein n=1 Tax=Micromonospora inyonensis TaxID=47866 RepID=UPI001FE1C38B|nr:hypothetical protein [Micromonospora inyonensis]
MDEELSSSDGVALLVQLVPVEPEPAVERRSVEDADEAEHDRLHELNAGGASEVEQVASFELCYRWRNRYHAVIRVRAIWTSWHQPLSVQCGQR